MDVKTHITLLQAYSEQLRQRSMELRVMVKAPDHLLSESDGNTATPPHERTERRAEEQEQFLGEVNVFCQRITRFLAISAHGLDSRETKDTPSF